MVQGRVLGGAGKGAAVCCVGRAVKGLYMQRGRGRGGLYRVSYKLFH